MSEAEIRQILTWLLSPFGLFVCGTMLGCAIPIASRHGGNSAKRAAVAVCVAATLQLALFSWYPVADLVAKPLVERARTLASAAPRNGYGAILLLGGVGTPPPEGSTERIELTNAAARVWLAARLYRAGLAPRIIVSGGVSPAADGTALMSEAASIRPLLVDLGVPVEAIVIGSRSLNTHGNAWEARHLIRDDEAVALVTSALHVPRAMRELQAAGITAHPFPIQLRNTTQHRTPFQLWLPGPDGLALSTLAIKEWLGIFHIWITDSLSSIGK